eukprot:gnl/Spiro4/3868_TR1911_c0_g1_i1.p1 gnl/Spiro4/3868_TR1911_c0_g1~~gnl/Spiro4/3868_TR1911_c0_g1_i1.p1  ORF type:complete len:518 (-),score=100.01 gnl/Spiro4/3868_TR1911_c0_g1_i1:67-1620(-)
MGCSAPTIGLATPSFAALDAARLGRLPELQKSVESGGNVPDANGNTPFLLAAENGHLRLVQWLLQDLTKKYCSLAERESTSGCTALLLAANMGQQQVLEFLRHRGASLAVYDIDHRSPLMLAALGGHVGTFRWLLAAGFAADAADSQGNTVSHLAAMAGRHEFILPILQESNKILDVPNSAGLTPFMLACAHGHLVTAKWLLEHTRPNTKLKLPNGETLLLLAAGGGHVDVVEWLLDVALGKPNEVDKDGNTLMHFPAERGHLAMMAWVAKKNEALISKADKNGMTPLLVCASLGQVDGIRLLCQHGASLPKERDTNGASALHIAVEFGHIEAVKTILQLRLGTGSDAGSGAILDKNKSGLSPLHIAAATGHLSILEYLVDHGSDAAEAVDSSGGDSSGVTALHIAAQNNQVDIVQWLVRPDGGGLTIHDADGDGRTALHHAAAFGAMAVARLLVEAGAAMDRNDSRGLTALMHARNSGQAEMERFLNTASASDVRLSIAQSSSAGALTTTPSTPAL